MAVGWRVTLLTRRLWVGIFCCLFDLRYTWISLSKPVLLLGLRREILWACCVCILVAHKVKKVRHFGRSILTNMVCRSVWDLVHVGFHRQALGSDARTCLVAVRSMRRRLFSHTAGAPWFAWLRKPRQRRNDRVVDLEQGQTNGSNSALSERQSEMKMVSTTTTTISTRSIDESQSSDQEPVEIRS